MVWSILGIFCTKSRLLVIANFGTSIKSWYEGIPNRANYISLNLDGSQSSYQPNKAKKINPMSFFSHFLTPKCPTPIQHNKYIYLKAKMQSVPVGYMNLNKVIAPRVITMAEGAIIVLRRSHPQTVRPH